MNVRPKLLDVIVLLQALPSDRLTLTEFESESQRHLSSETEGTIVHVYDQSNLLHYLVEFSDLQGCEYAMATLQEQEFSVQRKLN